MDKITGAAHLLFEQIPDAKLEAIRHAAHLLNLEQPEAFTMNLNHFILNIRAGAPSA